MGGPGGRLWVTEAPLLRWLPTCPSRTRSLSQAASPRLGLDLAGGSLRRFQLSDRLLGLAQLRLAGRGGETRGVGIGLLGQRGRTDRRADLDLGLRVVLIDRLLHRGRVFALPP